MKKKNLYQLVKQSLKEVLQEQRRNLRLNPSTGRPFRPGDSFVDPITGRIIILKPEDIDLELGIPKALVGKEKDIKAGLGIPKVLAKKLSTKEISRAIKNAGLSIKKFRDILDKADIDPNIVSTLTISQLNKLISDPIGFKDDFKGDPPKYEDSTYCDTITNYGTLTLYINDPVGAYGTGGFGGALSTEGCFEVVLDDSWVCCSTNNEVDNGLTNAGALMIPALNSSWSSWGQDFNCADLPDDPSAFTLDAFLAWYGTTTLQPLYQDLGALGAPFNDGDYLEVSAYCGIPGCTDSIATNYNASANTDDGSCEYVEGCMDEAAFNFDSAAVVDNGSCQFEGCTDAAADNPGITVTLTLLDENNDLVYANTSVSTNPIYTDEDGNPSAAVQDIALCEYTILGCTDEDANNYNSNANEDDGSCDYTVEAIPGCTDSVAINYNENATADNGTCVFEGCTDTNATNTNALTVTPTIPPYTTSAVAGYNAANYSDEAAQNDDLCTYPIEGCMDNTAVNYNPTATTGNISDLCQYAGCMDDAAANYDSDAVYDSVTYPDGELAQNEDLCQYAGCTDPTDSAYDSTAVWNPNLYASQLAQNQALCDSDGDGVLNVDEVPGCTNTLALNNAAISNNYNPDATDDDGSCVFNYCSSPDYTNYVCITEPSLCVDPDTNVACGDGENDQPCPDGIFNTALGTINSDLSLCTEETIICPDPLATNYTDTTLSEQVVTQTADYSACIYEFCNDEDAYNYSDVRPEDEAGNSIPWIANQDIPDNSLCEYVGCANNTYEDYDDSFEGSQSTEYPSSLSTTTVYYYNENNDGCEDDTSIGFGSGNGIEPTGNLNPANTSCCPGGDGAGFGCTDDGNLGQQYWTLTQAQGANYPVPYSLRTDLSVLAPEHTALPNYPGVSAVSVTPGAVLDDGSCQYNIGCMDPESVTYDPNAEINDDRLCKYCKDIVAVQCNPSADPNGYAQDYINMFGSLNEQINIDNLNKFKEPKSPLSQQEFIYTINRACVTIGGQKPEIGDEFLAQGIQYTSAGSAVAGGLQGNIALQINEDVNVVKGPDSVWDPLDDDPTLTYCCCPSPYPNTYINAEGPGATCGATCGGYPAPPEGCPNDESESDLPDLTVYDSGKPGKINVQAVFRVTQVVNHSTTVVTDLSPWQCSKNPPSNNIGIGIGNVGVEAPYEGPKIREIEISKKLRKSLTEMFKKKK